jgi:hypothetical protein
MCRRNDSEGVNSQTNFQASSRVMTASLPDEKVWYGFQAELFGADRWVHHPTRAFLLGLFFSGFSSRAFLLETFY